MRLGFGEGAASVVTGLTVLDYLLGEFARTARAQLSLEVAPGAADEEVAAAGAALGEALAALLRAAGASRGAAAPGCPPTRRSRAR